jgi:hypothetical protein
MVRIRPHSRSNARRLIRTDPSRSPPLRPELLDAAEDIPAPPAFDESALKREPAKAPAEPLAKTKAGTALPKWLKTGSASPRPSSTSTLTLRSESAHK